jgi:O-antigen/teichoic acid export membrane protein
MSGDKMRMVPAATVSFVVQVAGGGLAALTNLYLARKLGPASKGIAQVLVTVPAILIVVCNLGVHTAGAWFIGRSRYTLSEVLSAVLWWAVVVSSVLSVSLWVLREPIRIGVLGGVDARLELISLGCVPFYILAYYVADVLMASGRLMLYATLRLLPQVVYGITAVVLVGQRSMGLLGATMAFSGGIVASGLLAFVFVLVLSQGRLAPQPAVMRRALGFGGYVHAGTVSQFLVFRVDVLIVNALQGPAAAGLYAVAASLAEIVWYVGRSVESVIVPRIARAGEDEARQISSTAVRVTAGASLLTAAGIALLAPILISKLLPAFLPSLTALWFLLPAAVLSGIFIVAAGDLRGRGRAALVAVISIGALLMNIVLTIAFITQLGFVGAALASLLTYAAEAAVVAYALAGISGMTYRSMVAVSRDDLRLFRAITHQPW